MKTKILTMLLEYLLSALTPELMRKAIDQLLDIAEQAAADSENKVDDAIVLPLCAMIRESFDIPDNDKKTE